MMSHRKPGANLTPAPGDPVTVLELLEAGIWDWNVVTGELYLSPAWKRQLGYADNELENATETVDMLLHPDDRGQIADDRRRINDTADEFFEDECRLLHKNGTYRWVFGRARIVRDNHGRAIRMVGVDTDITERKRVEEALGESEERAQRAHRLAKTAHWSWRPEQPGEDWRYGTISFETAAEMFEIDASTFAITNEQYIERFVHPGDRKRVADAFAGTMMGRAPRYEIEYRILTGCGELKTVFEIGEAFLDSAGQVASVHGAIQDITERRRMEEALAVSEARMRRAQHMARMAHWVRRPDAMDPGHRTVTEFSSSAAALFGVPADSVTISTKDYLARIVHPDDRERVGRAFATPGPGTGPAYAMEYRIVCPDGGTKTVFELAENIVDPSDGSVATHGIIQDITERKRMEEALSQSEVRMRRAQQIARLGHWVIESTPGAGEAGKSPARWSDNAAAIFRTTPESLIVSNKEYVERFVHPLDRERVGRVYRTAENANDGEGRPYSVEYRILTADGELRTIFESAEPTVDVRPGHVVWNGVVQDITDRKRMEEALAISEARMRRAQQIAKMGSWATEYPVNTGYRGSLNTHYSAAVAEILGLEAGDVEISDDEFVRRHVHPDDRDAVQARYRETHKAAAGQCVPFQIEYRVVRPDGSIRQVNEMGEPSTELKPGWVVWNGIIQDITDRKRMEDALALSESRMRHSQQLAKIGHWIRETPLGEKSDGPIVAAHSENSAAIFDVTAAELAVPDEAFIRRFVHPADRDRLATKYRDVQTANDRRGVSYQVEYRVVTPAGRIKHLLEIAEPSADLKPGWVVWQGVIQDITDRKRMEEALSVAESRMRYAQKIAKLGHWVTSRDHPSIDWRQGKSEYSESAASIFGVTPKDLALSNTEYVRRFVHPDDRDRAMRVFEAVEHEDTGYRLEYRIVTPRGEVKTVYETALPAEIGMDGRVSRQGIVQDITERKKAEEAAAQREKLYRTVVESAFDAFVLIDGDARIVEWNPSAEQLFGWSRAEALGQDLMDKIFAPDQRQRYRAGIAEYFATGNADFLGSRNEVVTMKRDSTTLPAEVVMWPVSTGDRAMFSCFIHDLSAQRAMEGRLRHVLRMEAIGQLTGGVAHDFNNLLAVILLNAETLSELLDDQPRLKHLAELIGKAADGGKALIEQLSAFARRQLLRPQAIHLDELIADLMPLLLRSLNESIEVDTDLALDAWPAHIDPNQLENALINLAVNARDAMPEGGKLMIRTQNVALEAGNPQHPGIERGHYVLVSVSDTGIGMRPEILERVYEPFFTTKEVGKGSGLGLSSVYGFVSQSGGQMRIESAVGMGTTVHLYLPAADDTLAVGASEEAELRPAEGGHESVLVVEDDTLIRDVIESQLRALGYFVQTAGDGPSAVEILKGESEIELLLTDIVMPGGMSGIAVAEKARELRPGIKILYASGYPASAFSSAWPDPSKIRILPKPFRTVQLARAVREALDS
jgi:PAS domain S-box-containing protein